jgi:hypothetical protein
VSLGELRLAVIRRDRQCVAALLDLSHMCRDTWGQPHSPGDQNKLTLEHVKDRRGRRLDEAHHCIALCAQGNVQEHWSDANRQLAWAYLAGVQAGEGL